MNDYLQCDDVKLLLLLSQGNRIAFEILYKRHWETLYKTAFYILQDADACKDIVQSIFIWLWEHRQTIQIESLKPYLKSAVKFKVANFIRANKIRGSFFEDLNKFSPTKLPPTSEELIEIKELNAIIQHAIANLPEKCRNIFILSRTHNLNNREIAERLGISVKTVENQITIAIRKIRSSLNSLILLVILDAFK